MTSLPTRRSRSRSRSRAIALSLTALPALFAGAQTPPGPQVPQAPPSSTEQAPRGHQKLAPVTVQGQRPGGDYSGQSREALGLDLADRDVPQSISVITADQIADFGLRSANQALNHVTGVTVEQFETDRSNYTSRGFDITNFQFDGIGLPFPNGSQIGDIDTAVFEQVDVLRGANGLLSATGNPSATVNFIRKRPTAKARASAELTLGSWRDRRIVLDGSGPLGAGGAVRGRAIGVRERSNSYLDRYGLDKTVLAGLIDVDLGARTSLHAGHLLQRNDARSPIWGGLTLLHSDGSPTRYPSSANTAPNWSFWNNTDQRSHVELTHRFESDWTFKAVGLYRRMTSDSNLMYVSGTLDRDTGLGLQGDPARGHSVTRQRMGDIRLSGPLRFGGREHQLLLGANWGAQHLQALYGSGPTIALPNGDVSTWAGAEPPPRYDPSLADPSDSRLERRSLYAALHLKPSDRLGVVLGANLNQVESSGRDDGVTDDYRSRVTTPYAGATYELSAAVSTYASLTRVFNPQVEVDAENKLLGPAQGRNVEAGVKTNWFSNRLLASFAVFQARQDNLADQAGLFPDFRAYYRGITTTSTGFETEVSGEPVRGWELSAGYAQFRMHGDQGQEVRTFVPRRTLSATTSYRLPALPGLRLGASARWRSATSVPVDDFRATQKAYAVVDLMASYDLDKNTRLSFNLNNVGNARYLNSLYWNWAYYGPPRNAAVSLHTSF